jgi:hypothetical protein
VRKLFLLAWLGLILLEGRPSHANPRVHLKEGLWRIDVEMTLPGKGPQGGGPLFRDMCLTTSNLVQILIPEGAPCQGAVTSQSAKSMEWKMTCHQGQTVTVSRGHFEFAGDRLAGAALTTAPRYGMEFKTIIKGKYLSECPLSSAAGKAKTPATKTPSEALPSTLPSYRP